MYRQRLRNCRNLSIQSDGVVIQNVSCEKLLGVYIDKCLTWSKYVDTLYCPLNTSMSHRCVG